MPVQHIEDDSAFEQAFNAAGSSLIVIDFFATWCGPCRTIAPVFEQLSNEFGDVVFLKVDVDKCENTQRVYSVRAMPTFLFVRNRQTLHKIQGADAGALRQKLQELASDSGGAASSADIGVPGMSDLTPNITMSQLTCLNESDDHPVKNIFEKNEDVYLESDCDEELLMSLEFDQKVKLHSLKIKGPPSFAPKTLRLYINQPHNMDFDSARDGKPVQDLVLTKDDVSGEAVVNLKFVKFQSVDNLTIFVADNQGGEELTRIENLVIIGRTVATTKMSDFKRVAGKEGESH